MRKGEQRKTTLLQSISGMVTGRKLAQRYKDQEFTFHCECSSCASKRGMAGNPRTWAERMKRQRKEAAARAKLKLGIW